MTPTTTAPNLTALFKQVEEISLRVGGKELNTLWADGIRLGRQQEKWTKVSMIVGCVIALGVFVVVDLQPGDYAVIAAAALAIVSFGVALVGLGLLGKSMTSAQTADWTRRAEQAVREHGKTAS
jgi:hypothetical protein